MRLGVTSWRVMLLQLRAGFDVFRDGWFGARCGAGCRFHHRYSRASHPVTIIQQAEAVWIPRWSAPAELDSDGVQALLCNVPRPESVHLDLDPNFAVQWLIWSGRPVALMPGSRGRPSRENGD